MTRIGEFPGIPVVRAQRFHCRDLGLIPGQGTKILHALRCSQNKANEQKNLTRSGTF